MATQTTISPTRTSRVQRLSQRLGLTTRPETFGEQCRNSAAVWLALMVRVGNYLVWHILFGNFFL